MIYIDKFNLENRTDILQFVPVELKYLTEKTKIKYNGKNIKTAYLIDIIHSFMTRKFFTNKDTINLSSVILRKKYGTFYNYYLDYLIEHKILVKKKNYWVGARCSLFSLSEKYIQCDKGNLIRWKNNDKTILKKWKNNLLSFDIDNLTEGKVRNNTKDKLIKDLQYVEVDYDKASNHLFNLFEDKELDDVAYWKNQLSIETINDGSIFHVEDKYGRLHTNYTVLKKVIREDFVTIDGQDVNELDIKNSQPLFLSLLLRDNGFDLEYPEEYQRYYNSVKSGVLYEEYMAISGLCRKKSKESVYKILFAKNCLKGKNAKINKHFKQLYPNIWDWLCMIKNSSGDYKIIAHLLQKKESEVIFDNICTKIYNKIPQVKMFTVHDSIYYPKQFHTEISDIFYHHLDMVFA